MSGGAKPTVPSGNDPTDDGWLPAEVRAARRALGSKTDTRSGSDIVAVTYAPIGPDIEGLLESILSADHVDIVGVLPWPCAERLIELDDQCRQEQRKAVRPRAVRYLTPARDRITLYRHSGVLGTVVQRWIGGITGVRNWLRPRADDPDVGPLSVYEFDDVFLDCIVHTEHHERHDVTIVSQLPRLKAADGVKAGGEATLVITAMPQEQVADYLGYLESLVRQAMPLSPRHVLCSADHDSNTPLEEGNEFRPVIVGLNPYSIRRPAEVVLPVVALAVCVSTPRGPAVVLKRRTVRNSVDDFDKLSLISERVLLEDLAELLTGPADPDLDQALEDLWLRAGQPETFDIPETAFRRAAQRELFMSCGLDVAAERLEFCGTCLLDREGENSYLGFYVYRLDLVRTSTFDELTHAKNWNPDLSVVPLRALDRPETRNQLNRLLRRRDVWLREKVFNRTAPAQRTEEGDD
jgi:hypothetical protein